MQALSYLHEQKIIHCDLKSSNVFIDKDSLIKIGDFGLSKKLNEIQFEKRGGTPLFLPPELIYKKNYDEKIDIWGIGCILFHMAQLQPPFQGDNFDQVSTGILTKQPVIDQYSEKLKNFILQMLEKNPQKRPSIQKIQKEIPQDIFSQIYQQNYQTQTSFYKKEKKIIKNIFKDQKNIIQDKKQDIQILDKNDIIKNIYMNKMNIHEKNNYQQSSVQQLEKKNIQIINQQIIYHNNFYQINNINNNYNINNFGETQRTQQDIQENVKEAEKEKVKENFKQIINLYQEVVTDSDFQTEINYDKQRSKTSQPMARFKINSSNNNNIYEQQFQQCDKEYEQNTQLQPLSFQNLFRNLLLDILIICSQVFIFLEMNSSRTQKFQIKNKQPFLKTQNNFFKPQNQIPTSKPIQDKIFINRIVDNQNSKFKFTIQDLIQQD